MKYFPSRTHRLDLLAFSGRAANNCQPIMPMTTVFKSAPAEK
jgi:hypothetical protein